MCKETVELEDSKDLIFKTEIDEIVLQKIKNVRK